MAEATGAADHEGSALKRHVLFVHGGGEGAHEEDRKMAANLRDVLGASYDVRCPKMPNEDRPEYEAWKNRISEERLREPVAGVFLVAPPYWGAEDWRVGEYALREGFASNLPEGLPMFFYHSRDDEWVPFAHLALYAREVPHATVREFDGRGHQFDDDLSEIAHDIERLERSKS